MNSRIKIIKIIIILFIPMMMLFQSACLTNGNNDKNKITKNRQNRVKGEYLVKLLKSAKKNDIDKFFKDYKIIEIKLIRERLYKIRIKNDPGPETLQKIAEKSGKFEYIEPNYIYRINPPSRKEKLKRVEE